MGMRRSARLAKELADERCRLGDRHVSWHVLRRLCRIAEDKTICGDRDCLRLAQLAVRIAGRRLRLRRWRRRAGESSEIALSFGQLATALRLASRFDHAETALRIAFQASPPHLEGVLYRRRAWIRLYQARMAEALRDAERAVALANEEDFALAVGTLAATLYYNDDFRGAIARYKECLAAMDPADEEAYCGMLGAYAGALAQGTAEEAETALELVQRLRTKLKPGQKMQRAKLWWIEGLLEKRLEQLDDAWWALDVARRSLVAMKAAPEVAAVIADMAAVFAEPTIIGVICTEAAGVIADPHPLAEPLQALAGASREQIPAAAIALRQEASQLAACPTL
jgi:tetratricopeptide (TPR) repeat protein